MAEITGAKVLSITQDGPYMCVQIEIQPTKEIRRFPISGGYTKDEIIKRIESEIRTVMANEDLKTEGSTLVDTIIAAPAKDAVVADGN
jgi:hypothetical protein